MKGLPLDRHVVLQTSDLEEARATIWQHMHEHPIDLIGPSEEFNARIHGRLINQIAASCMTFGTLTRTEPGKLGFFLVQIVLSGTYTVRLGDEEVTVGRGEAVVLSPNEHVSTLWSADCVVLAYQIQIPGIEGHLGRLLGAPLSEPLRFRLGMDVRTGRSRDLFDRLLRPLARELNQVHGMYDNQVAAARVEDLLMTALLRTQQNNYSTLLERAIGRP